MPERHPLHSIFQNNLQWSQFVRSQNPEFFTQLERQQTPEYLWIGCSDSRVSANEIMGLLPGEVFVHRNVANVVVHTDFNCLSVLQYAIDILKVRHIIVTGHYGCGGVRAALENRSLGLIDNWLRTIKDVYCRYEPLFTHLGSEESIDLLCELNVRAQVSNVCHTTIVQDAWKRNQPLSVHGLIYRLSDGILHDLDVNVNFIHEVPRIYQMYSEEDFRKRLRHLRSSLKSTSRPE